MSKAKKQWQPLVRVITPAPSVELINETARVYKISVQEAAAMHARDGMKAEYWVNDLYQVQVVRDHENKTAHINIRRRDGDVIFRDWRHFQQIKNELVGPECEAIELYPAESRLTDSANKYHLWAVTDPTFRFPVGFPTRDVQYEPGRLPGTRQRPLGQMAEAAKAAYDEGPSGHDIDNG